MKKRLLALLFLPFTLFSCAKGFPFFGGNGSGTTGGTTGGSTGDSSYTPTFTVTSLTSSKSDIESYYSKVDWRKEGKPLRNNVAFALKSHRTSTCSYDGLKTVLTQTDLDPHDKSHMIGFYDAAKLNPKWDSAATWNREHTWPNSRGAGKSGPGSDPHIIRPASVKMNSERGNAFFGESGGAWDPGQVIPQYRGAAARIILYAATYYYYSEAEKVTDAAGAAEQVGMPAYGFNLVEKDTDDSANHSMGRLSMLLYWNLQYPVNDYEIYRNETIQKLQGVRNPFIDNPSLGCRIWGKDNVSTRNVCGIK